MKPYIVISSIVLFLVGILFSFISISLRLKLRKRSKETEEWARVELNMALNMLKSEREQDIIIACHRLGALGDYSIEIDDIVKEIDSVFVSTKWKANSRVVRYAAVASEKLLRNKLNEL